MSKAIDQQAREIAVNAAASMGSTKVGFIELIIPIIAALIPLLVDWFRSCQKPNPVPSTPQEYVSHRYDDGEYDHRLLKLTIKKTRDTAKKQCRKLSKDVAQEIAIATLDQIRLAEDNVVGACMRS